MANRLCVKIAIVYMLLAPGASGTWGQTSHAVERPSSEVGKIEFENESIIVVRIRMAPHEKTPMHDIASARLVIWLTDAHLKDSVPDGLVTEYSRLAGSIDWVTPRRHMGENVSERSLEFLAIIPKGSTQHATPPH